MAKKQAPNQKQAEPKKDRPRARTRFGKRKGSAGGKSHTAIYPRGGDAIDTMYRLLHNLIVRTPAKKWGCDSAGKPTIND